MHWARFLVMKLGIGTVQHTSMAPLIGPLMVLLGAHLAGEPLSGHVGWWVLLADSNTWSLLGALAVLAFRRKLD